MADFVTAAVSETGGSVQRTAPQPTALEEEKPRWSSAPPSFLSQPRAYSALRRELDSLADQLGGRLRTEQTRGTDRIVEHHSLPHRLVARLDEGAISFSWIAGRLATVADGRLLVIQWDGVASHDRGVTALKSATPIRERVYRVDASGPDSWCWRGEDANGRACSTTNLVAEWVATMSLASAAPMVGVASAEA